MIIDNFNNQVTLTEVVGHRTHHSCKQVANKTTGDIYASATDAAEKLDATVGMVSNCCLGRTKSCKGNVLEYIDHTSGNVDSFMKEIRGDKALIAELKKQIAVMEADAAVGRAIREAQEAKAKAKENAQLAYDKATAKVERRKRMVERREAEYQEAVRRLMESEAEQSEAWENLIKLKED